MDSYAPKQPNAILAFLHLNTGWLLIGIATLFIPLVATSATAQMFEVPKVFFLRLTTALLAIIWLHQWFTVKRFNRPPFAFWPLAFLAGFLLLSFLSTLFSLDWRISLFGTYDRQDGLWTTACFALITAYIMLNQPPLWFPRLILVSALLTGFIAAWIGFGQWYGSGWFPGYVLAKQVRPHGTFHYVNTFAGFISLSLVAGWGIYANQPNFRIVLFPILLFLHTMLWATFCRGAWLCITSALILLSTWTAYQFRWKSFFALTIPILSILVGSYLLYYSIRPAVTEDASQDFNVFSQIGLFERAASSLDDEDLTVNSRYAFWTSALKIIRDHPWLGTGPETFQFTYLHYRPIEEGKIAGLTTAVENAHNFFLHTAATKGLLSLIFLCLLYGSMFLYAMSAILRRPPPNFMYGVILIGWCTSQAIQQLNPHSISSNLYEWILLALLAHPFLTIKKSTIQWIHRPKIISFCLALGVITLSLIQIIYANYALHAELTYRDGCRFGNTQPLNKLIHFSSAAHQFPFQGIYQKQQAEALLNTDWDKNDMENRYRNAWNLYHSLNQQHPHEGAYRWGKAKTAWALALIKPDPWLSYAEDEVNSLLADYDAFPHLYALSARIASMHHDWATARRHIKNAIELDSNDMNFQHFLACIEQECGNIEAAEKVYRTILSQHELFSSRYNLALLLWGKGKYDEAIYQMEMAVSRFSHHSKAQQALKQMYASYNKNQVALESSIHLN